MFKRIFVELGLVAAGGCNERPNEESDIGDGTPPPDWAHVMDTAADAAELERRVAARFELKGISVSVENGWVELQGGSYAPGHENLKLGLTNLAAVCAAAPKQEWDDVIEQHFQRVEDSLSGIDEVLDHMDDFSWVESRLGVRIFPPESLSDDGGINPNEVFVVREDLRGLLTTIVTYAGGRISAVNRKDAEKWQVDDDALFDRAFKNVHEWASNGTEQYRADLSDGTTYQSLVGDSPFVSTLLLMLDTSSPLLESHGLIVAVPARDIFLILRVNADLTPHAIHLFQDRAAEIYHEGPGSISPNLYWKRGREFMQIQVTTSDATEAQIISPSDLMRLIAP